MSARGTIDARLLFVSASVDRDSPLAVDREYNRVKSALESIGQWKRWRSGTEHLPAAQWDQLPGQLLAYAPSVVHFAGHGYADGSLELSTHAGTKQRVQAGGLRALFESYRGQVRMIVLNACYSDALAAELTEYIDVVIGMTHRIADDAAVLFAPAFYQQLAGGKSVQTAFEVGCAVVLGRDPSAPPRDVHAARSSAHPDAVPHMRVRAGVDASRLFVAPRGIQAQTFVRSAGVVMMAGVIGIGVWQLFPSSPTDAGDRFAPLDMQYVAGGSGVDPFWVARTELTQQDWMSVTGANPSAHVYGLGLRHPVNRITWDEAIEVANALTNREGKAPCYERAGGGWRAVASPCRGYRLLTDAEWDFLDERARGEPRCTTANIADRTLFETRPALVETLRTQIPNMRPFSCSDGFPLLAPVGSLASDRSGLWDIDGNVSEWIWLSKGIARAVRGSSFISPPDDDSATRADSLPAGLRKATIGVRYARDGVQ